MSFAYLSGAIAPRPAAAFSGSWYDGALQQFYPLPGSHAYAPDSPSYTENYGNGGSTYDGNTAGNTAYFKGPAGSWYRIDLGVPQTTGRVTLKLSKLRIYFGSTGPSYKVQVCAGDDPNAGPWTDVVPSSTVATTTAYTEHTFPAVNCRFVRIVNLTGGWLNFKEIDFWGEAAEDATAAAFRKPGMLVSGPGVDLVRQRLTDNTHPAGLTFPSLASRFPATAYTATARTSIYTPVGGSSEQAYLDQDGEAAYRNALMWRLTGTAIYGQNAVGIVDAWASAAPTFSGSNTSLTCGLFVGGYLYAADLLRSGAHPGWTPQVESKFKGWLNARVTPMLEWDLGKNNSHGNWSTNVRRTALALAVFGEDRYQFNRLVELHKRHLSDDSQTATWGEVHETCRTNGTGTIDLPHQQMFLSGAVGTAEIAWNQGVDLYAWKESAAEARPRLAQCMEYMARVLNVGDNIDSGAGAMERPHNILGDPSWTGRFLNADDSIFYGGPGGVGAWGWEYAYNHYSNRRGLILPEISPRLSHLRANGGFDGYTHSSGLGTLTHAGLGSP